MADQNCPQLNGMPDFLCKSQHEAVVSGGLFGLSCRKDVVPYDALFDPGAHIWQVLQFAE